MTSAGTFGIEVGGGDGGAGSQITEGALGATYRLDAHGFTKGVLFSDGTSTGNLAGSPLLQTDPATPADGRIRLERPRVDQ